ncbi:alpha/beta hydrolase [Novipirellula galeiformis]|nr:alpha/beta hydrolase [Novipirellula galeiformis]
MGTEEFFAFARSWMQRSEGNHCNLLFIHGFQNSFNDAAIRAGQLGVDLKIPGSTFFYSWPSAESPMGYSADEATIETSVSYCHDFVFEILSKFPDVPLHVVAHSMGNRLAVNLFEKLATAAELPGELGQLIFAAADIDVDRFKQATPTFRGIPKRMTSYVSRGDLAVHLSERLHDFPRLGLAPPVTRVEGVDTILVEGFPVSELLGHGYFADSAPVLYDMFNLIRHGSDPDNRPLIKRETDSHAAIPFWSLPLS